MGQISLEQRKQKICEMIGDDRLAIISELYEKYKDNLVSVYVGGSGGILQYIENPRDLDIIFVFKDAYDINADLPTLPSEFVKDRFALRKLNEGRDIKCSCVRGRNAKEYYAESRVFLYYPLFHGKPIILHGDDIFANADFNILHHREETLGSLKVLMDLAAQRFESAGFLPKYLYWVAIQLFILKNGTHKLTKSQLAIINKIHDNWKSDLTAEFNDLASLWEELSENA